MNFVNYKFLPVYGLSINIVYVFLIKIYDFVLFYFYLFAYLLVVLEFELRALCLLGRYSFYYLGHTPSQFYFSYFSVRDCGFLLRVAMDCDPSTSAFHVAGSVSMSYHTQLFC
jgi:hypothetical protein